jgi:hypothetical protein
MNDIKHLMLKAHLIAADLASKLPKRYAPTTAPVLAQLSFFANGQIVKIC